MPKMQEFETLKINKCFDCDHRIWWEGNHCCQIMSTKSSERKPKPKTTSDLVNIRKLHPPYKIPDWCPLENYVDYKKMLDDASEAINILEEEKIELQAEIEKLKFG